MFRKLISMIVFALLLTSCGSTPRTLSVTSSSLSTPSLTPALATSSPTLVTQTPNPTSSSIPPTLTSTPFKPVFGNEEISLFNDFPNISITDYDILDLSLEGKSSKYLLVAFYQAEPPLDLYAGTTPAGRSYRLADHSYNWPEMFIGFNSDESAVNFINCLTPSIKDWMNSNFLKGEIIGIYPIDEKTFLALRERGFAAIWFGRAFDDALAIKEASKDRVDNCIKSIIGDQ